MGYLGKMEGNNTIIENIDNIIKDNRGDDYEDIENKKSNQDEVYQNLN